MAAVNDGCGYPYPTVRLCHVMRPTYRPTKLKEVIPVLLEPCSYVLPRPSARPWRQEDRKCSYPCALTMVGPDRSNASNLGRSESLIPPNSVRPVLSLDEFDVQYPCSHNSRKIGMRERVKISLMIRLACRKAVL